jgi:3-methyl-2-oxobutanoate hydroxymethyltransferase
MTTLSSIERAVANDEPVTSVTAYDSSMARLVDRSDIDMILVGDTVGITTLGYDGTDRVTVDEMVHHAAAVTGTVEDTFVMVDLPFGSYNTDPMTAVENANRLKKEGGADAVKLEGGREVADAVEAITAGGIPVIGHIGVTPQTTTGTDIRASTAADAERLLRDAEVLDTAGVSGMVLELVASEAATSITDSVEAFTIGIGAGAGCDVQGVTLHDLLGLQDVLPETAAGVRADFGAEMIDHLDMFHKRVRKGDFPGPETTGQMDPEERKKYLENLHED